MRSLRGNNFGFKALNRLLEGGGGGGKGYTSKIWVGSLQM